MGDGAAKGGVGLGAVNVYMNPLMITSSFGKLLDAILANGEPIAHIDFYADFALQVGEGSL
jgi:hypothetical protein